MNKKQDDQFEAVRQIIELMAVEPHIVSRHKSRENGNGRLESGGDVSPDSVKSKSVVVGAVKTLVLSFRDSEDLLQII